MSLLNSKINTKKLFDDLYFEFDHFTNKSFSSEISKILNASLNVDLRSAVKVMLTFRKVRKNESLKKHKTILYYKKKLRSLFASQNNLNDGDAHSIGILLSLDSCSKKAQEVLNVKRLKHVNESKSANTESDLYKFITQHLKFANEKIKPSVKDTSLHGLLNKKSKIKNAQPLYIFWFRLKLQKDDLVQNLKTLLTEKQQVSVNLLDIGTISEDNGILEFYYSSKANIYQLLEIFNDADQVKEIIFCSNLVGMNKLTMISDATRFSNMLKFYYIYKTYNLSFMVRNQADTRSFFLVYSLCSLFMHTTNLTSANNNLTPNPLSSLSCSKPMITIKERARTLEPLTKYEENVIAKNSEKLSYTAATKDSIEYNSRHKVCALTQDRDTRIITGYPNIGGVNASEMILNPTAEQESFIVDMLKSMTSSSSSQ
ncbi:P47 [Penaeus vannamei nudivirus]|nr:P47 [Penaeus vannamei nucleopolyhedrovirus]